MGRHPDGYPGGNGIAGRHGAPPRLRARALGDGAPRRARGASPARAWLPRLPRVAAAAVPAPRGALGRGACDRELRAAGARAGAGPLVRRRAALRAHDRRLRRRAARRRDPPHADRRAPAARDPDARARRPRDAPGGRPRPRGRRAPRAAVRGAHVAGALRAARRPARAPARGGAAAGARGRARLGAARREPRWHAGRDDRRRGRLEPPPAARPLPRARRPAAEGLRPDPALPARRGADGRPGRAVAVRDRAGLRLLRPGAPQPRLPRVRRPHADRAARRAAARRRLPRLLITRSHPSKTRAAARPTVAAMPRQTIFPALRYRDARAAVDWLSDAFGFERVNVYDDDTGVVQHAEMRFGDSLIMFGQARGPEAGEYSQVAPPPGNTALYAIVDDPDAHHDRAKAAGAEIVTSLRDQ